MEAMTRTLFSLWIEDFDRALRTFTADVQAEITRMQGTGMLDSDIAARILQEAEDDSGSFQSLKGWVEGSTVKTTTAVAQFESLAPLEATEELLTWDLDPTAAEHCDDCIENSEAGPKSFDDWAAIGLPGAGNTACNGFCKCSLSKAA